MKKIGIVLIFYFALAVFCRKKYNRVVKDTFLSPNATELATLLPPEFQQNFKNIKHPYCHICGMPMLQSGAHKHLHACYAKAHRANSKFLLLPPLINPSSKVFWDDMSASTRHDIMVEKDETVLHNAYSKFYINLASAVNMVMTQYRCFECGRIFNRQDGFNSHVKGHKREKKSKRPQALPKKLETQISYHMDALKKELTKCRTMINQEITPITVPTRKFEDEFYTKRNLVTKLSQELVTCWRRLQSVNTKSDNVVSNAVESKPEVRKENSLKEINLRGTTDYSLDDLIFLESISSGIENVNLAEFLEEESKLAQEQVPNSQDDAAKVDNEAEIKVKGSATNKQVEVHEKEIASFSEDELKFLDLISEKIKDDADLNQFDLGDVELKKEDGLISAKEKPSEKDQEILFEKLEGEVPSTIEDSDDETEVDDVADSKDQNIEFEDDMANDDSDGDTVVDDSSSELEEVHKFYAEKINDLQSKIDELSMKIQEQNQQPTAPCNCDNSESESDKLIALIAAKLEKSIMDDTFKIYDDLSRLGQNLKIPYLNHLSKILSPPLTRKLGNSANKYFNIRDVDAGEFRSTHQFLCDWIYGWNVAIEDFDEKESNIEIQREPRSFTLDDEAEKQEAEKLIRAFERLAEGYQDVLKKWNAELEERSLNLKIDDDQPTENIPPMESINSIKTITEETDTEELSSKGNSIDLVEAIASEEKIQPPSSNFIDEFLEDLQGPYSPDQIYTFIDSIIDYTFLRITCSIVSLGLSEGLKDLESFTKILVKLSEVASDLISKTFRILAD
ncbi:hypothetical protein ROZALSC1DRAFT_24868, partial [Rozella allomycis CSF55]